MMAAAPGCETESRPVDGQRSAQPWGSTPHPGACGPHHGDSLEIPTGLPAGSAQPRAQRAFSGILGRLRRLGARDLAREGSVLKSLLEVRSVEEIGLALDGLEILFPGQPISLRMIHGKAMIGNYRGFQSAVNAAIRAQERRINETAR